MSKELIYKQTTITGCAAQGGHVWKTFRIDRLIAGQFHDEFMKLMKNPVKLPPHLKSVPEWLRRMLCCAALPMLVIEKAKDNGMFPQCANYPAPAILISVREA